MTQGAGPIIQGPGEGEPSAAFGLPRWFRVTAADTDGAFAHFEEEIPEGAGPPLHIHHEEREVFTVLSGRVKFHCEGREAALGRGRGADRRDREALRARIRRPAARPSGRAGAAESPEAEPGFPCPKGGAAILRPGEFAVPQPQTEDEDGAAEARRGAAFAPRRSAN